MATNQVRRTAIKTLLGGLSVFAGYGAFYQLVKYNQSSSQWTRINNHIQEFQPIELSGQDAVIYPWLKNNTLSDWEYRVVKIKGWFREERFFVRRQRDGKDGYLVFAPFITATKKLESDHNAVNNTPCNTSVFVNLGWVPLENKGDIEMTGEPVPVLDAPEDEYSMNYDKDTQLSYDPEPLNEDDAVQLTEITALVRRGEKQDILHGRRNWQNEGVFQWIDLNFMSRFFRVYNINGASTAYLERIVPSYEEEDEELYPVPASKINFEKPINTPSKYLSNSFFLGGTSAISIVSLLSLLKR